MFSRQVIYIAFYVLYIYWIVDAHRKCSRGDNYFFIVSTSPVILIYFCIYGKVASYARGPMT